MTHLEQVKSWAVCEVLQWVSEMETLQSHEEESCAGTATFPERGWWGYCNPNRNVSVWVVGSIPNPPSSRPLI